jgi:integrase
MAVARIDKRALEKIGLGEIVWDTEVKGFGIRRHTTEAVFYLVRCRCNGRQTFKRIGRHGAIGPEGLPLTPDTARNEAQRLLGLVTSDTNPQAKQRRPAETFRAEVERYLAKRRETMKPRAYEEIQRHLMKHAKPMHCFRLAEIDRRALAVRLDEIETENGPAARNRVRSSLSAFFTWAVKEGLLDANPISGTAKAEEGGGRERVLTPAELAEVWAALPQDHFADIVRLLILTGQRREEIGAIRWSEVHLKEGLVSLPPERTKNKCQHEFVLSPQAKAILERQPRRYSRDLIFGVGKGGFSGWSGCKDRLDQAILARRKETNPEAKPMPDWVLHDLRRTAATCMAELGVLPHIVEGILNHVGGHKAGVAGGYDRARYLPEMREALVTWANHIEAITSPLRPKAISVRAIPLEEAEAEAPRATFAERAAWLARLAK